MNIPFAVAIHLTAAVGALALGPVALWARQGATQRPRLHRAMGYAWVTLMVIAAGSTLFMRNLSPLPSLWGYSPIHILVPVTFWNLYLSFAALARGDIGMHRKIMQRLYWFACAGAGFFALLPQRFLGKLVWGAVGSAYESTPSWVFIVAASLLAVFLIQIKWRESTRLAA